MLLAVHHVLAVQVLQALTGAVPAGLVVFGLAQDAGGVAVARVPGRADVDEVGLLALGRGAGQACGRSRGRGRGGHASVGRAARARAGCRAWSSAEG